MQYPEYLAQFEALLDRKTHEAIDAHLPPYLTRLDAPDPADVAIGNAWTRRLFDGPFSLSPLRDASRPSCSLVFVQSRDGNTGARNPSTLGGGQTDKHLIYEGLSRVAADAVLAGAETVRGTNMVFSVWHPELVALRASLGLPRHPTQVVATLVGLDLDRELLFNLPEISVVLLTVGACTTLMHEPLSARPWIRTIVMEDPSQLRAAFEGLRSLGIARVSCVGGRKLATQLLDAGLVDDIYLTTAARPGGEPDTPMYPKALDARLVVCKDGTGPETGVTFERLSRRGA